MIKDIINSGLCNAIGLKWEDYQILNLYYVEKKSPEEIRKIMNYLNRTSEFSLLNAQMKFRTLLTKFLVNVVAQKNENTYLRMLLEKTIGIVTDKFAEIESKEGIPEIDFRDHFNTQVLNILKANDIKYFYQLYNIYKKDRKSLLYFRGLGKKCLAQIDEVIENVMPENKL